MPDIIKLSLANYAGDINGNLKEVTELLAVELEKAIS